MAPGSNPVGGMSVGLCATPDPAVWALFRTLTAVAVHNGTSEKQSVGSEGRDVTGGNRSAGTQWRQISRVSVLVVNSRIIEP
jgi:hypothetical protein